MNLLRLRKSAVPFLTGRQVVVSGGSSGIGRGITLGFAQTGGRAGWRLARRGGLRT